MTTLEQHLCAMIKFTFICLVYLTAVALTSVALRSTDISLPQESCSKKFCTKGIENCSKVFDECICSTSWRHDDMLCPKLSGDKFIFRVTKYILTIQCTQHTQDLTVIIQYFDRFVNILNRRYYRITNCCKSNVGENCTDIGEDSSRSMNILDLSALPRNENIKRLALPNNYIQDIKGRMSVVYKNLNWLMLGVNYLKNLSSGLLSGLTQLQSLYMRNNQLEYLYNSEFLGLYSLQKLNLAHNKIRFIEQDVFADLTNLTNLDLSNNLIQTLPEGIFKTTTNLITLLLSSNNFTTVPFFIMQDLTNLTLNMSNNCISHSSYDAITIASEESSVSIANLICMKCCLTSTSTNLLSKISNSVNFASNHINIINAKMLMNMGHLDEVDLSFNHITEFDVSGMRHNVSSNQVNRKHHLTTVMLNSSEINCDCHVLPILHLTHYNEWLTTSDDNTTGIVFKLNKATCSEPMSLRVTLVSTVLQDHTLASKLVCKFTAECPMNCNCYTIPHVNVNVVNCTRSGLTAMPNIDVHVNDYVIVAHLEYNHIKTLHTQIAGFWYKMKEIYLDNNEIYTLDGLLLSPVLSVISLRNNKLTDFQSPLKSLLSMPNVTHVSLSGNPWTCNCDLRDFKAYITTTGKVIDYNETTCNLNGELHLLLNSSDYDLCPVVGSRIGILYKAIMPFTVMFLVVCSILSIIAYKYRSVIKLWLFSHGYCLRLVTEEDLDANKIFDAFVSYSSDDEEWVNENIVIELEGGHPPYKLCIHGRDWIVGESIMTQILHSVQCSRRTIIILTKSFVESEWSRLEFEAAYQQALNDNVPRVLVVIPGEVPDVTKLGSDLSAFITLNTYIKWTDDNCMQKLRSAMPRGQQPGQ